MKMMKMVKMVFCVFLVLFQTNSLIAGLVEYSVVDIAGAPRTELYSQSISESGMNISGNIYGDGHITLGREVNVTPDNKMFYRVDILNGDDDAFVFTLFTFDNTGVLAQDEVLIDGGSSDSLAVVLEGYSTYTLAIKISGKNDSFYDVRLSNYSEVDMIPEPSTLATLAFGLLFMMRRPA